MRTTAFLVYLVGALFVASVSHAIPRDEVYEKTMNELVVKLYAAPDANTLQQCKNQFERLHSVYPEEWLPLYYLAYSDIQLTDYDRASAQNEKYLEEAKTYLEKLDKDGKADQSEVKTLWGYYFNALTLQNPEVNGQKYYTKVLSSYTEAITLNPENPRPVCLMAMYEQYLPEFLRSGKDTASEKEKARLLFEKETPSIDKPYWGAMFLEWIKVN